MICRKCGHTDGMHDERGCVALNCSCDRYVPLPTNAVRFDQPGRGPLMSYPRRIGIWSNGPPGRYLQVDSRLGERRSRWHWFNLARANDESLRCRADVIERKACHQGERVLAGRLKHFYIAR
jgi:hypothetical protein